MLPLLPIESERLLLRSLKVEDAADYHALETDLEVKQFLGGASGQNIQFYESSIAEGAPGLATTFAVTAKETGQFFGRCGFTEYAELGDLSSAQFGEILGWEINIVLSRQCPKRRGYATEIGLALIRHGLDMLGCNTILGVVDAANIASLKLCEKLGMKYKRDTKRYERPAHIYSLENRV